MRNLIAKLCNPLLVGALLLALPLVGVMVANRQVAMQVAAHQRAADAATRHVSLAYTIARCSMSLAELPDIEDRQRVGRELAEAMHELSAAWGPGAPDAAAGPRGAPPVPWPEPIVEAGRGIRAPLGTFLDKVARVIEMAPGPEAHDLAVSAVGTGVNTLFPRLNELGALHLRERNLLMRRLATVQLVAVLLAGAVLAVGFLVYVRPVMRSRRRELTRLARAEEALDSISVTDPLTKLGNIRAARQFLQDASPGKRLVVVAFAVRPAGRGGRAAEAEVLLGLSAVLAGRLRDLDIGATLIARVNGPEFVAIYDPPPDEARLAAIFEEIRSLGEEPFQLQELRVRIELRLAVAERRPFRPVSRIIDDVRLALAEAFEGDAGALPGTDGVVRYHPGMRRRANARRRLGRDLRVGIMGGEIEAHFQPQLFLATGRIAGFEALARWRHPRRGLLSPATFLPIAERLGLDEPLGEVMVRQALQALTAWDERGYGIDAVGVNMTALQLSDPRFVDLLAWELDRFAIDPRRLCVEVLESVYADNDEDPVVRNIRAMARHGIRIDLDDYGTGAASITGIRRFGPDRVKIDRSFIADLHRRPENRALVRAIVGMARDLGIEALAEGIETAEELAAVRAAGCDYVQGMALGRPMPLAATFDWIEANLAERGPARPAVC